MSLISCFSTIFLCFFLLVAFPPLVAQSTLPQRQGFFLEGAGVSQYYSLNYTRRIFATEQMAGYVRIGGSIWGNGLAVPMGISLVLGRRDHQPEITFAVNTFSEGLRFWNREESDIKLDLVLGLGYRYQPKSGRFFAGAGLYPYLRLDPTLDMLSEEQAKFRLRPGLNGGWYLSR